MPPTKCNAHGSPRVFKAMLFTSKETIGMNDVMKLAGYTKREISWQQMEKGTARKY
jgi:hypothetical protein